MKRGGSPVRFGYRHDIVYHCHSRRKACLIVLSIILGTMFEDVEWPVRVNLTLNLRKSFDITYIRLKFHSPRPESFAIYKRTTEDNEWVPYQFYSANCRGQLSSKNTYITLLKCKSKIFLFFSVQVFTGFLIWATSRVGEKKHGHCAPQNSQTFLH